MNEQILIDFRSFFVSKFDLHISRKKLDYVNYVNYVLSLTQSVVEKRMKRMTTHDLNSVFLEFVKAYKKEREEKFLQSTIIDFSETSRIARIRMIVSYFFGSGGDVLEKRYLENEYVEESIQEIDNIFISMRFDENEIELPKHVFVRILSFIDYNRYTLNRVGRVNKNIYLLILSTWRRIRITPRNVFLISILVLKNVRELIFTKKSISLSKKEMIYIWDHITPSKIELFNMGNSNNAYTKFLNSITQYEKTQKKSLLFENCHTLFFTPETIKIPNSFSQGVSLRNFPNIRVLHIGVCEIFRFISNFPFGVVPEERKLYIRELHLTIHSKFTFGKHKFNVDRISSVVHPRFLRRLYVRIKDRMLSWEYQQSNHREEKKKEFETFFNRLLEVFNEIEFLRISQYISIYGGGIESINISLKKIPTTLKTIEIREEKLHLKSIFIFLASSETLGDCRLEKEKKNLPL